MLCQVWDEDLEDLVEEIKEFKLATGSGMTDDDDLSREIICAINSYMCDRDANWLEKRFPVFKWPLDELPLHVNDSETIQIIVKWRFNLAV